MEVFCFLHCPARRENRSAQVIEQLYGGELPAEVHPQQFSETCTEVQQAAIQTTLYIIAMCYI